MITISLMPTTKNGWNVCRCRITLFRGLQLGAAIKLGRELARDEYLGAGYPTCVEMRGDEGVITLAQYGCDDVARLAEPGTEQLALRRCAA